MNEQDLEAIHASMISQFRERVEQDYLELLGQGVAQPVVMLLDLRAPLAQSICREVRTQEEIQNHIQEAERRGVEPAVTWGMSVTAAAGLLVGEYPEIVARLQSVVTDELILAVCVSDHGVSVAVLPAPA